MLNIVKHIATYFFQHIIISPEEKDDDRGGSFTKWSTRFIAT